MHHSQRKLHCICLHRWTNLTLQKTSLAQRSSLYGSEATVSTTVAPKSPYIPDVVDRILLASRSSPPVAAALIDKLLCVNFNFRRQDLTVLFARLSYYAPMHSQSAAQCSITTEQLSTLLAQAVLNGGSAFEVQRLAQDLRSTDQSQGTEFMKALQATYARYGMDADVFRSTIPFASRLAKLEPEAAARWARYMISQTSPAIIQTFFYAAFPPKSTQMAA